jgi:nucleoprotein TPR
VLTDVLHQHPENVSSQAIHIRQIADSTVAMPGEGDTADGTEAKLSELCAVINYLRKQKEFADMQLELGQQENARLKVQFAHVTHNLEDMRDTLSGSLPRPNY